MTPSRDDGPLHTPHSSIDSGRSNALPKRTSSPAPSIASSISSLPHRRSTATLSSVFASTSTLRPNTPGSGTSTPHAPIIAGSVFSPPPRTGTASPVLSTAGISDEVRALILRSFVPHVGVVASPDTEEICRGKGFAGGFLELIRPYGDYVPGKVTIRDSNGASKSWDDFGVRFTGLKDGLGVRPRRSTEARPGSANGDPRGEPFPFVRVGGDVGLIEEAVDRHLSFAELQMGSAADDYFNSNRSSADAPGSSSPFYRLYLRRLLSGLPISPHETFSHPVACIIAISSRCPNPIEQLRQLYQSTNNGDHRLPQWVNNDYLRYYVLVHDEDHDDIGKSTALYEQMKRHFGLHCHLLRLRSTQCVSSDDDAVRLPISDWLSASEELAEIQKRETSEDVEDPTPCLFESDATAIRTFVRELVTQSIVPTMERYAMQWNEQIASKRKGISGRFMSLSKRWTGFGSSSRNSGISLQGGSGSNYDSLQGFYRPDAPEALMRKLADYAFMLRDFRLAASTYEILRSDFNNDKAWKYYAGANEMTVISTLLVPQSMSTKTRIENIDQMLETASYSYLARCEAPYNALRGLALSLELLKMRGHSACDDAARWAARIIETRLVGAIGHALFTERISDCYSSMRGVGSMNWGMRRRKAGLWAVLAADAWMKLDKSVQAEKCLDAAASLYGLNDDVDAEDEKASRKTVEFESMRGFMDELRQAVVASRLASRVGFAAGEEGAEGAEGGEAALGTSQAGEAEGGGEEEIVEEVSETLGQEKRHHRKSLIGAVVPPLAGENALSPMRTRDDADPMAFLSPDQQLDKAKDAAAAQEQMFEKAESGQGAAGEMAPVIEEEEAGEKSAE
ncbi:Trapp complex protein trs85 [Lasiodiplodia theobromae]|uniref:Transport protein particle subunit trs85-2 n=1 Tax=Lasiodiplodia theobromae TaxID=45133 RepID=A0A5N5DDD8_9PEZI|nr:Trapp complex protein trs85 [Lasiodiplodia theobromae]KAB2575450.1 Transport protein particle subunit trs85-2 [Lasiodiplodia theobromae]KAF4546113.1 Trapp complex protein trs85 [Lasiodiplodia theobromae]